MSSSSTIPGRSAPAVLILAVLLALIPAVCHGELQPSFIKGTVLNAANGAAIPNATITTTTGLSYPTEKGLFFLRVPPNVYNLIFSAPGYRSNMATGIFSGPGQTATVTIRLAPASTRAGTLQGRVTPAGATTGGLSGALVFTDLGTIALTDDKGYFTAVGPSGTATVTVAAQGYSSKTINNVEIHPLGLSSLTVVLNKTISGLTGQISGTVRDACSGQQLAGTNISSSNGKFLQPTDGTYKFTAPPGYTALLACSEGYQCGQQTAKRGFLPFGAVVNFSLVPLVRGIGTVSGAIIDAETGQPVAGARIATDTHDITFSDSAGTYSLQASPCASLLTINSNGYKPYSAAVTISAGIVTDRDAALEPLTSCIVSGTVKSFFTGLPVAGAQLRTDSADIAASDASGAYSLNLSTCTALITFYADGFFKASKIVSSSTGAAIIALDISLIPCPFCRYDTAAAEKIPLTEPQY